MVIIKTLGMGHILEIKKFTAGGWGGQLFDYFSVNLKSNLFKCRLNFDLI